MSGGGSWPGERTEEETEETEATLDTLPAGTRQISFYSYGEISPHASGRCVIVWL